MTASPNACVTGADAQNDALNQNPALAYHAITEGMVLFCRDQEALVNFKTRGFLAYLDTAFLRTMVARAFQERLAAGEA